MVRKSVVIMIGIACAYLLGVKMDFKHPVERERPVVVAVPSVKLELDPHKMEDIQSMFLAQQLHRSLLKFGSDGSVRNDLLEQVAFSADGKVVNIKIRSGQMFSDGTAIRAEHVVASLKRPFDIGSSIAGDLSYLKGAQKALEQHNSDILSIASVGPFEVKIELDRPSDLLSTHLALPDLSILQITDSKQSPKFQSFSGPFKIIFKDDNQIILEHWRDIESGPRFVKIIAADQAQIFDMASQGLVDSIEQFPLSEKKVENLKALGWKAAVHSLSYENFLLMNPKKLDKKIRKAIRSRLSKISFAEKLKMEPAYGLIPPSLPGSLKTPQAHVDSDFRFKKEIEVDLNFNEGNVLHRKTADLIAYELSGFGIKINLVPLKHDIFYEHLFSKKSTLIIAGKGIDYPDGLANLAYFRTDVPNNFLFMEDSSLNDEIRNLSQFPEEIRIKKYEEIQNRILNQNTIIPLFFGHTTSGLWHPRISSVPSHPFGFQFLRLDELGI